MRTSNLAAITTLLLFRLSGTAAELQTSLQNKQ